MELRDPLFLLLACFAPLAYFWAARPSAAVQYSSLTILDRSPPSLRVRLSKLPPLLWALTVLCLAVALAGPRVPNAETRVTRDGIAIMAVIDRSGSMQARDLVKNDLSVDRLQVVKDVLSQFVKGGESGRGRPDDMIGLVSFARFADSLCPLTLDHGNLVSMVTDLEIARNNDEDGTAIGDGLALAVERLRLSKAKSKVAILLTDGSNNAGAITPEQAGQLAASLQIKVYCIGAGTNGLAPFPAIDPFSGQVQLQPMQVKIDEGVLEKIAQATGGQYYRATDKRSLSQIYAEIDRLERTAITEIRYLQYTEYYQSLLVTSLALMTVAAVASNSWLRTLP